MEPGGFSTEWGGPSAVSAEKMDAYAPVREANATRWSSPEAIGDPEATGPAILELVDAEDPPLRIFFGANPLDLMRDEYARRVEAWERWDDLSKRAHGNPERSAA